MSPPASNTLDDKAPVQKRRPRLARAIVVLSAICLCGIALSIWLTTRGVTDVTLYQVGNQNVSHAIGGGGIVFPYQQLVISYPSTERVVSVLVKPGDMVTPNQPLLRLDPTQLSAQITQASNDVAAAQAYLSSVSAGGNALAVAHAQQEYELAKNKYNALVAQTSSTILHSGNLIAPMAGIVTAVNINTGEVFAANTSLVTIMDESKVVVRVKIPLINLQQIAVGQPATVTPSALPNVNLPGVVSTIIPQADPQTDTFEVWVEVVNTNRTLLPGMSAFARIQEKGVALTVPRLALLNADHESIVFVARNQHAYVAHVQVVGQSGNTMLVSKGLRVGDRVVVVGVDTLHDGQAIRARSVETASKS
jgi:RND family efflux transporter MFP subunit